MVKIRRTTPPMPDGVVVRDQDRTFTYASWGPILPELKEAFDMLGSDALYVWARLQDWQIELDLDALPSQVQSW
jgi:hypothetical protein